MMTEKDFTLVISETGHKEYVGTCKECDHVHRYLPGCFKHRNIYGITDIAIDSLIEFCERYGIIYYRGYGFRFEVKGFSIVLDPPDKFSIHYDHDNINDWKSLDYLINEYYIVESSDGNHTLRCMK